MVLHLMMIVILLWDFVVASLVDLRMVVLLIMYHLVSDELCLGVALIVVWC